MRPGITGPWQVLGRRDIPFNEMLKLDYSYVLNWSAVDDLKLLVSDGWGCGQGTRRLLTSQLRPRRLTATGHGAGCGGLLRA